MSGDEFRDALRVAASCGDAAGVLRVLAPGAWPADALQVIGDGLLVAQRSPAVDATAQVSACVAALRERGWAGDWELAEALESGAGQRAAGTLPALSVDLEELADVLEGGPANEGGRIDRRSGEVWPKPAIEYAQELGEEDEDESEDQDKWLWVACLGSRDGYQDMEWFIDVLDDPVVADRLSIAISGRGAFRRFRDVLYQTPELVSRWHAFSEDRKRGRARAWLARQGYAAAPRSLPEP